MWPIIVPQQKFVRDPKWWVASLDVMAKTNYGLWSLGRKACKTDLAGYSCLLVRVLIVRLSYRARNVLSYTRHM